MQKKLIISLLLFISTILLISCTTNNRVEKDNYLKNNSNTNSYPEITTKYNNNLSTNRSLQSQINYLQYNNIIYFKLDKYDILTQDIKILDLHVDFLLTNPSYKVIIEGHADERGTPEYNISLGEKRAHAVSLYLQSNGVLSNQISTISYGKEKPAVFGHNEEAYSKNRRAVLKY